MISPAARTATLLIGAAEATWFYTRGIYRKIRDQDILFLASGLAFNGVLTMIPLMLLSASALGIFLNSSALAVQRLNEILNAIFPPQPFAMSIKASILNVLSEIVAYRTSLGIAGAAVLIWTGTSLFDALRSVLHTVYGIKRRRGLLASLLHDIGFVFLVFLLFLLTNFALWIISLAEGLVRQVPALATVSFEGFNRTFPTLVVVVLSAGMFYIIYRYIPDTKPPRAAGVISTITTTVLWVISGRLFAVYLSRFSAIGTVYGPYAFVAVLLFWIYYSSIIFILGGMVGQVYWERRRLRESGELRRWI